MKTCYDRFRRLHRSVLTLALAVLTAAAVLLGGCSSDSSPQQATPDESAPTAAPTAEQSVLDEAYFHGEAVDVERFIGSWVSYPGGKKITYTYDDDGCAIFLNEDGSGSEYHYEIEGDRIVLTSGEKRMVYIWSERAVTFIADHEYGEAANVTALIREQISSFAGYMYVQGDYLFVGKICMCRADQSSASHDDSIVGSWTGAEGDRVTFTADGAYEYRDQGLDYHGTYIISQDGETLTLCLPDSSDSVLSGAEWGVSGRVLRLMRHYYFRDADE